MRLKQRGRLHQRKDSQRRGGFSYFGETSSQSVEGETTGAFSTMDGASYIPLSLAQVGDRLRVCSVIPGTSFSHYLTQMGLGCGSKLEVISHHPSGSTIVAIGDRQIGLGSALSSKLFCTPCTPGDRPGQTVPNPGPSRKMRLREIAVGAKGRVIGYEPTNRSYKRRLLSMGLTPGTEFKIIRHAPLGDPTEIKLRGFSLTLRKDEADALCIEKVDR
jgi:ferrous iron transport protein A